ncbi:uncharacterized protein LOC126841125 [Adelges cooleyi]|uniref:uncharacterized protein LOC126841125 n=1 Tax=Adelges cooleyi TaxID=133065 RepID=UPI00217F80E3|nr:uncharacterized protein LOC126841125 [Adelges cooleyi]
MATSMDRMWIATKDITYENAKKDAYFEWVEDCEISLNKLTAQIFDDLGMDDEVSLNVGLERIDTFQEFKKNQIAAFAKKVVSTDFASDKAKQVAADWADTMEQMSSIKYHTIDGASAAKLRWAFETLLKYFITGSTCLANQDDKAEHKIAVSEFAKDLMQSLLHTLQVLKNDIEALKKQ